MILNPEASKQIGEAARKKIESELTWDAVARKYLEMFEEAILLRASRLRRDEGKAAVTSCDPPTRLARLRRDAGNWWRVAVTGGE